MGVKIDEKTRHSIIGIGHGKIEHDKIGNKIYAIYDTVTENYIWIIDSADLCSHYIIMDDGRSPYEICEWKEPEERERLTLSGRNLLGGYEPDNLMVPLYKRMFLEAQDAYDICTSALASSKAGIHLYHYPHYILICQGNIKNLFDKDIELEEVSDWEPFKGYDHNLFSPEKIKQKEYNH